MLRLAYSVHALGPRSSVTRFESSYIIKRINSNIVQTHDTQSIFDSHSQTAPTDNLRHNQRHRQHRHQHHSKYGGTMAPAVKKQRMEVEAPQDVKIEKAYDDTMASDGDDNVKEEEDDTPMSIIAQFQSEDVRIAGVRLDG